MSENNLIKSIDIQQYGIEKTKAEGIRSIFIPMCNMLDNMEQEYSSIMEKIEKEGIKESNRLEAKNLRMKISKIRIATEGVRKKEKEFYLNGGRAVDGIANILKNAIFEKENNLKEIENYFIKIEQERKDKLQNERANLLLPYEIEDTQNLKLGEMSDEVWNNFLEGTKQNYIIKKEAEEKARKEKEEEEKKQRASLIENEKLKKKLMEQEEKARKEKEEQEEKAKQQKELEKSEKINQFKLDNNYDPKIMELKYGDNRIEIWKKIAEIKI